MRVRVGIGVGEKAGLGVGVCLVWGACIRWCMSEELKEGRSGEKTAKREKDGGWNREVTQRQVLQPGSGSQRGTFQDVFIQC
jgi:hypothetical protein